MSGLIKAWIQLGFKWEITSQPNSQPLPEFWPWESWIAASCSLINSHITSISFVCLSVMLRKLLLDIMIARIEYVKTLDGCTPARFQSLGKTWNFQGISWFWKKKGKTGYFSPRLHWIRDMVPKMVTAKLVVCQNETKFCTPQRNGAFSCFASVSLVGWLEYHGTHDSVKSDNASHLIYSLPAVVENYGLV